MDKIEKIIRPLAIYSPKDFKEFQSSKIFDDFKLLKKYEGQMSRVFKIEKEDWLIKESKWDLKLELFKPGIPVPVNFFEKLIGRFTRLAFLPKKKEILRQYSLYLEFVQYLGFFSSEKDYYHPNQKLIYSTQKQIRQSLLFFKEEIEKKYNFKITDDIKIILSDEKTITHNFIPKEYQLVGESISKENKGKTTSFIFQEFLKGELLYDTPEKKLSKNQKRQLVLMIYLLLLMNLQTGIFPDTRPRYNFLQAYNWLTKTDNIMVTKDGLKFIDTRWFWDTKSFSFLLIPSLIPKLAIEKAKFSINSLVKSALE